MAAYVHRPFYENELQQHKNSTDIKVITGVRRCGKSSLMSNLAEQARSEVGEANVFYRRMDHSASSFPTAEWLERELADALSKRNAERMFYVFLDEIQDVSDWEKVVRRLHTQEDIDAYITGSNAHVLSSGLATLLGGRYAQILVQPLSFMEFLSFANARKVTFASIDAALAEYVRYGGMPAQFDLPERTEEQLAGLLETIYETIVLNDVAMHASIADFDLLSKLVRFTFSTSGNLYSTRAVVNTLASAGQDFVGNRRQLPEGSFDAFILDECEQTGLAGKQVLVRRETHLSTTA
ncbi:MAG: ATP-binding protein [Slackia sp.]